jgi:hypothetical protein
VDVDADSVEAGIARMRSLIEQERYQETFDLAGDLLEIERVSKDETMVARVIYLLAEARWRAGDSDALDYCWKAVEADPCNEETMWLIREIEGLRSPHAREFRIVIHGRSSTLPFFAIYTVAADDEAEALRMAARFEDASIRDTVMLDRADPQEPVPDELKGVYWRSGTLFYGEDES